MKIFYNLLKYESGYRKLYSTDKQKEGNKKYSYFRHTKIAKLNI